MPNDITTWLKFALQQMAAESYLDGINRQDPAAVIAALVAGNNAPGSNPNLPLGATRFVNLQTVANAAQITGSAQAFVGRYQIVDPHANDATGFSATLIQERGTNNFTLSFRSTEYKNRVDGGDYERDGANGLFLTGAVGEIVTKGFAFGQLAAMEAYYTKLKTDGTLPAGAVLNVTGYSLGAHLATVFAELHAAEIQHAYTFNGPGRGTFNVALPSESAEAQRMREMVTKLTQVLLDPDAGLPTPRPPDDQLPSGYILAKNAQQADQLAGRTFDPFAAGNTDTLYSDARYLWAKEVASAQFGPLSNAASDIPRTDGAFSLITQIIGHASQGDIEYVANSGNHAAETRVFIEDQPNLDNFGGFFGASGDFGTTHSITLIVDSLALQELFQTLAPTLTQTQIEALFAASSNDVATGTTIGLSGSAEAKPLENALDPLRRLFLPGAVADTPANPATGGFGNLENRNKFYEGMAAVKTALAGATVTIEPLVTVPGPGTPGPVLAIPVDVLITRAQENTDRGLAYRYALKNLNPFAVIGADYAGLGYTSNGALTHFDPITGLGALTDQYITDRAVFLNEKLVLDLLNNAKSSGNVHFKDFASNGLEITTTPSLRVDRQFLFGSDGDEGIGVLVGGGKDDHLYGGGGNDLLEGGDSGDYLQGDAGVDRLDGGTGADTMVGGAGSDFYLVDNIGDQVIEGLNHGTDRVESSVSFTLSANVEHLTLTGTADLNGTGNELNNDLTGNAGINRLDGQGGTDHLIGGIGNDVLAGGTGNNDLLEGGAGFDTYIYNAGDGTDRIEDSDANGQILFNGHRLLGGIHDPNDPLNTYTSLDGLTTYVLSETDLIVDGVLTINENFQSGQFGIQLRDVREANYDNGYQETTSSGVLGLVNNIVHYGGGDDVDFGERGNDQLFGEDGNDALEGNTGDDRLSGGTGNDFLRGDNVTAPGPAFNVGTDAVWGRDVLDGGDGDDTLIGDWGDDILRGGAGIDLLYGDSLSAVQGTASANDFLDGGDGNDELHGQEGDDVLYGGAGNDFLSGEDGNDVEDGGAGDDLILAYLGNDSLAGGTGLDTLYGDQGNDVLDGGDQADTLHGGDGADSLFGGAGDDRLLGDGLNNPSEFSASGGTDFLDGGAGKDHLEGGIGDDTLFGGTENDVLFGDDGADGLFGDDGDDELHGGVGNDLLSGDAGNDRLFGQDGADTLYGDEGDDALAGNEGNDTLIGGVGSDVFEGGHGDDVVDGGVGHDIYLFNLGDGHDTITDTVNVGEGNLIQFGAGITLQSLVFTHDHAQQKLTIHVSAGDSITLLGFDLNSFQYGVQTLAFANGSQVALADQLPLPGGLVEGDDASNVIRTGSTDDTIFAGAGNDVVISGAGNDVIVGGVGADILQGGAGQDTYVFNAGDGVDTILDTAGEGNKLVFGTGITANSISLGVGSLLIRVGTNGDAIHIQGFNPANPTQSAGIDVFEFADGTSLTHAQLVARGFDLIGTNGNDVLDGGAIYDKIYGLGGNDQLIGGSGNNSIYGGAGQDLLAGNDGADQLLGEEGDDSLFGEVGNDRLDGGAGTDYLQGDAGDDVLLGGTGNDVSVGGAGNDTYQFSRGDGQDVLQDTVVAGAGNVLAFGPGLVSEDVHLSLAQDPFNPSISELALRVGSTGDQVIFETFGVFDQNNAGVALTVDTFRFTDGTSLSYQQLLSRGFDLTGTAGGETMVGTNLTDRMHGAAGDDRLRSGQGDDVLDGGVGNDELWGGEGNDAYVFGPGSGHDTVLDVRGTNDVVRMAPGVLPGDVTVTRTDRDLVLSLNGGADRLTLSFYYLAPLFRLEQVQFTDGTVWDTAFLEDLASGAIRGTANADVLQGTAGHDLLVGFGGDDQLTGLAGDDVLDGGTDADRLTGSLGDDTYVVDHLGDVVVELANEGVDRVDSSISYTLGQNVEQLSLTGTAAINGTGNALDNILTGNSAANVLAGGLGDDTYVVGAGDAIVELAGAGIDSVISEGSTTLGANVENLTIAGSRSVTGTGNALDNVLSAPGSISILAGGAGNDLYLVGPGDDLDMIVEASGGGIDTVRGSQSVQLPENVERLELIDPLLFFVRGADPLAGLVFPGRPPVDEHGNPLVQNGTGNALANTLVGTRAANVLDGGLGADMMLGGQGDDVYRVDNLNDVVGEEFGGGFDRVESSVNVTLSAHVEDVLLTGTDSINGTGNELDNFLEGNSGDNVLEGGVGNDLLVGGEGNDAFVLSRGTGQDQVFAGFVASEVDRVQVAADIAPTQVAVRRYQGDLVLQIAGTEDTLRLTSFFGSPDYAVKEVRFADGTIWNRAALLARTVLTNTVPTSAGNSEPVVGTGDDTQYTVWDGSAIVNEAPDGGIDTVQSYIDYTLGPNVEHLILQGDPTSGFLGPSLGTGNDLDNLIIGSAADNILDGKAGNDVLVGGYFLIIESYFVVGGNGSDILIGGEGDDTLIPFDPRTGFGRFSYEGPDLPNVADDILLGGQGNDTYILFNAGETITELLGEGIDTVRATVNYTLGTNVENLTLLDRRFSDSPEVVQGVGNELDNVLIGNGSDNVLIGGAGDDTLSGGSRFNEDPNVEEPTSGNDLLIGGIGHDTYLFNAGDGIDTIQDIATVGEGNRIQFGTGIAQTDLTFTQNPAARTLTIQVGSSGTDQLILKNFDPTNATGSLVVETLAFADGSTASLAALLGGPVNHAPTVTTPLADQTVQEDAPFSLTVPATTFADQDAGDVLSYNASLANGSALPTWLSFNTTTRTFTGTPDDAQVGPLDLKITATDTGNLSVADVFTLTVQNVNDTPTVANPIADQTVLEDALLNFVVPTNTFADVDAIHGDTLAYSATLANGTALPSWLSFNAATRTFMGTPDDAQVGSLDLKVTATDQGNLSTSDVFTMTVQNVNEAPTATTSLADQTTLEDAPFSFTVPTNTFTDQDAIHGDTLTYSATLQNGAALPTWLTFNPVARTFSGTPLNGDVGVLNLAVNATDTGGLSATRAFTLTVQNVNDAPTVATLLADKQATQGAAFSFVVPANTFADVDVGDTLTYSTKLANGSPLPVWLSFNATTRTFTGTPQAGDVGTLDVRITATDTDALSANDVFTLTIAPLGGTPGNDTLIGTPGNDTLDGLAGDDILQGLAGNDTLIGGLGNDLLDGGAGTDTMTGGTGHDTYVVDNVGDVVTENLNEGTDLVQSSITYTLGTNVENLTLTGTAALTGTGNALDNMLIGNSANNTLTGGAGNDTLNGGAGPDTLVGGTGNDTYVVDATGDVVTELVNEGTDTVQSSITYILGANVENLTLTGTAAINGTGNALDNILIGNSAANVLTGGAGNDTYLVSTGDTVVETANNGLDTVQSDVTWTLGVNLEALTLTGTANINGTGNVLDNILTGNSGANVLTGGAGNDIYVISAGDTVVEAANGGTETVLSDVTTILSANVEALVLSGSNGISGTGNNLANVLTGNNAANVLDGGTGADTMAGLDGHDTYLVDNIGDLVIELANNGLDTVQSSVSYTLAANVENLTLTGTTAINGTGNALDNVLTGNSAANVLTGGTGNDTYVVGTGDTVTEAASAGTDTVQSSITWTLGSNLENLTLTGTTAINGTGNTLDNVLIGNSAANVLTGGTGNDTYVVGTGDTVTEAAGAGTDTVQSSIAWTLGVNLENLTLLGVAAINGTGNASNNVMGGNSANNVLTGLGGNDTYLYSRGGGQDTVVDNSGASDTMQFGVTINPLDLVISRQANDLRLAIHGASDQITVQNWYVGTVNRTETIQAGNGQTLLSTQVDQLIQAMAGFTQQTGLTWDQAIDQQPTQVQAVLAASWQ